MKDNKGKKKRIIIIFLLGVICLIIVLFELIKAGIDTRRQNRLNNNDDNKNENVTKYNGITFTEDELNGGIEPAELDAFKEYKRDYIEIADSCISKYLGAVNESAWGFATQGTDTTQDLKQNLYNLLSENFINKNNVTVDNVKNKLDFYDKKYMFTTLKMEAISKKNDECSIYYVEGILQDPTNDNVISENKYVLYLNENELYFAIEPIKTRIAVSESKIKKENNTYMYPNNSEENIVRSYLRKIKNIMLGDPGYFYQNLLNKEYSEKRFASENDFKEYVEEHRSEIFSARLERYDATKKDEYIEYIALDQHGIHFVVREVSSGEYSVLLDTHTLDENFDEVYSKQSDDTKARLVVERIQNLINDQNFHLLYLKLNNEYRETKIKDEQNLKDLITFNIYKKNIIAIQNLKKQGDTYVAECVARNEDDQSLESRNITFIIKLKEGNDFEFSLSV